MEGALFRIWGTTLFGSKFFSNLTHYVRSGDFVLNLIRDSQDLNEYAFSLGALSHYAPTIMVTHWPLTGQFLCSTRSSS